MAIRLIQIVVYLVVWAAGLVVIAVIAPLGGDALQAIGMSAMDRYGTWAGYAVLFTFIGTLALLALWVHRWDARREYERTGVITIEKRRPTPLWAKMALGVQAVFLVLVVAVFVYEGVR